MKSSGNGETFDSLIIPNSKPTATPHPKKLTPDVETELFFDSEASKNITGIANGNIPAMNKVYECGVSVTEAKEEEFTGLKDAHKMFVKMSEGGKVKYEAVKGFVNRVWKKYAGEVKGGDNDDDEGEDLERGRD